MAASGSERHWLEQLSEEDRAEVLGVCESRTLQAGEVLFREGESGDSMWLLQQGRVEVFKAIQGGVERQLTLLGPGDTLGELSFLDGSVRSAGARAMETSTFSVLSRQIFAGIERARPGVAALLFRSLAEVLAQRLRVTNERYRESVAFGMSVVGTSALNLRALSEDLRQVRLHLSGGGSFEGRILQVDQGPTGVSLIVQETSGGMSLVPLHALQRLQVL